MKNLILKEWGGGIIHDYPQYDYVIINDGSRDSTADVCRRKGYNLIDLPVNLGLSGAFQTGVKYAVKNDYDAVLQLDGDGQHRPEYIADMIAAMKEGADIVIGSRYKDKHKPRSLRMLGSYMISFMIGLVTKQKIKDPTSGMRLYGSKVLKEFAVSMNYGPEPDTIAYLIRAGIKVKEVQVEMDERTAGESYLNLVRSVKYMVNVSMSIVLFQFFRKR